MGQPGTRGDEPSDAAALAAVADEEYAYLTTTGRVTGRPHEIEIWFAVEAGTVYFLSGGRDRSDWVQNIQASPGVTLRIGDASWDRDARIVGPDTAEDATARRLLFERYDGGDGRLTEWRDSALPVAVDVATGD